MQSCFQPFFNKKSLSKEENLVNKTTQYGEKEIGKFKE